MDASTRLTGDEWENWGNQLLSRHYGAAEYQRVPSDDSGDAGIEGYTFSGEAFQMYGPENAFTVEQEYSKYRDKITDDIAKFCNNSSKLSQILGSTKIRRWVLFVPQNRSKKIISHAKVKTKEVRQKNLPYATTDFEIVVLDESAFLLERKVLINGGVSEIEITAEPATEDEIKEYKDNEPHLIKRLDAKILKIPTITEKEKRVTFRDIIIKNMIELENMLDELRSSYPEAFDIYYKAKSQREKHLEIETMIHDDNNKNLINESMEKIIETLKNYNSGFSKQMLDNIALGTVAEWLVRCPLDFPERSDNG